MNKRPVDKTKKSNKKCEHCNYWERHGSICRLTRIKKNYWNICKEFAWSCRFTYKD